MADAGSPDAKAEGEPSASPKTDEKSPRARRPKTAAQLVEAVSARQAAFEKQHWDSCGKQVSSSRPTRPNFSFGGTGRITEDVRAKEICQHPSIKNPGPVYTLPPVTAPCPVVKHWGLDKRFLDGDTIRDGSRALVKGDSTLAAQGKAIVEGDRGAPAADEAAATMKPRSGKSARAPGGEIYCKYASDPHYSFGSSAVGARFSRACNNPIKAPAVNPHLARLRFRELRDQMPMALPSANQSTETAVEA